jgi:hypothetical protein
LKSIPAQGGGQQAIRIPRARHSVP